MSTTTKSRLRGREPATVEPSKPKILIYGKAGVGKSMFALEFPDVYFIDVEGGADLPQYQDKLKKSGGLYFGPSDGALDFSSVLEQVQALATEEHDRKTLVIDSVSKLFNNQIALTQDRMAREKKEDAFGASKKEAVSYMRRLVAWIAKIDMNVVLIHHQKSLWHEGKEVGVTYDGWDRLEYELHLVLRVEKMGPARQAFVGKTRLSQFTDGNSFPWSFNEFANRFGADVIGRKAVKLNLCDELQQAEYRTLMGKVKIDPSVLEKWESAAPDIALLESEAMANRISWLKKQLEAQTAKAA